VYPQAILASSSGVDFNEPASICIITPLGKLYQSLCSVG
jgi:hypothetical protein